MSSVTDRFDVLVVGCGIAGLSAAVAARQAGASVGLVERAPREERGGNTRWTEAFWRMRSADEVAHDFESHFMANAGHYLDPDLVRETARDYAEWPAIVKAMSFSDPELIAAFAKAAGPTLRWLEGFGIRFDFLPSYLITQCTTRMAPVGGGLQLVETLAGEAERRGVEFLYETTARELISEEHGAVAGIKVRGPGGRWRELRAASVVLASGGFEGNPEMLARYIGPHARYTRPVARGGHYNKGEGIRMALALNAAPNGDYSDFHAEPIDPRSGKGEPIVFVFPYGVLVNRRAERFVDEASATVDAIYENVTRRINEQPQGIAYVLLDAGLDEVPNWQRTVRSDQPAIVADSLAELAGKLELPAERLSATIAAYNAACRPGRFKPLELDGLSTHALYPAKSNWARPIDRPPYRAWPIIAANCFTFGGLKTDSAARVLDLDGQPIAGLYAAGETMGLYFGTYTGATSVMRGAVFGRIAGEDGARRAQWLRQAISRGSSA